MIDEFIPKDIPMFSASYDAEKRIYTPVRDKQHTLWLYAKQENSADNIYVEGGSNSDGFGGREITFKVDGGSVTIKGPWKTNSEALFSATGVDIRNKHLTFGVVAKERVSDWKKYGFIGKLIGILYKDEKPVIGTFDRIKDIAQRIADKRNEKVYCFMSSEGGSSSSQIGPN